MDINVEFRKVIPITKAWEGDDGELYIEGESSGPEIDKDEQFMTKNCVADMAAQVNQKSIPFGYYDEHNKRGVMSELGAVVAAEITPNFHMKNRVRLDKDNPAAVLLWKKIHDKRKQFGMSIAGRALALVKKTIGDRLYQGFGRIGLDHIANTTKPSWSPSLGTLVAKSLEQDGFDWADAPEYGGEIFAAVERAKPKLEKPVAEKAVEQTPPEPLVYGKENLVNAEPKKEESMAGGALTSFDQTVATDVGTLPIVEKGPEPSVGDQVGGGLTSFQQVADDLEEQVTKQQAEPVQPDTVLRADDLSPVRKMGSDLLGFVDEVFASSASVGEKRETLAEIGKSYFSRLGEMLEGTRPEEDRLRDTVMKAIAPLMGKIETLERQLAVAKSQPLVQGDDSVMVRKSLRIGVRPARVVDQQQESPTFEDLVRNPQGGGWAPAQ